MSANNFLYIKKITPTQYKLEHKDADSFGLIKKIGEYTTLEEAINKANEFESENEVEYGLRIKIR